MARGPITNGILGTARKMNSAPVDIAAVRRGRDLAAELKESLAAKAADTEMHPVHAYWTFVQHHLSMFGEELLGLPQAHKLADLITDAEAEYTPAGPPMSPLTRTYFFGWSFCDLTIGIAKETAASCTTDVVSAWGIGDALVGPMRILSASRMGLWTVVGHGDGTTLLGESVTGEVRECVVPSGHVGRRGEFWLVRVLPPPLPEMPSLVFNTPYVLMSPMTAWNGYLDRTLRKLDPKRPARAYPGIMKYGKSARYWPEYIFEAYANHSSHAVFLLGLPDVDGSRPHGEGFVEPRGTLG